MMRALILLLFVGAYANAQVNMWTYDTANGGNNNGELEQSEVQAALDNESNLFVDPQTIIVVSSTLDLDQAFAHDIDWNNSTITTITDGVVFFDIDKNSSNGGTTAMTDLLIDANDLGVRGVLCNSRVELTNIDGIDYRQASYPPTLSATHIYTQFLVDDSDSHGNWVIDGCDVNGLWGFGNYCDYCDGIGAANGFLHYWRAIPTVATEITIKNGSSRNGFGVDGQNVAAFSPSLDMTGTLGTLVYDNMITEGFDRRGWKIFTGNVTIKNCDIKDNLESLGLTECGSVGPPLSGCPKITPDGEVNESAGLLTVGRGSGATGAGNIYINNVTVTGVTNGTDPRLVLANIISSNSSDVGVSISNTNIVNGDLIFTGGINQDVEICNTNFQTGSTIQDYGTSSLNGASINYDDSSNTYASGSRASTETAIVWAIGTNTSLTCPPIEPTTPTPPEGPGPGNGFTSSGTKTQTAQLIAH